MRTSYFFTALALAISGTSLQAQTTPTKPAAPTELKVRAVGVNAFEVLWKDNSTNESGFEILLAVKGTKPQPYTTQLPNYIGKMVITNDLPKRELNFQVRAYVFKPDGSKLYSKKSATVTAKTPDSITFNPPTKLTAKTVDDGQILLRWKDNATSEVGYSIEFKLAKNKKWKVLGTKEVSSPYKVPAYGFDPKKAYNFRVRGVKGSSLTTYSNIASATTKAVQYPSKLTVKSEGDGKLSFKWKDNSSLESGFELHQKIGSGAFTAWVPGFLQPNPFVTNATSSGVLNFTPNTAYQFKLRSYRTVKDKRVYGPFTNTVSIKSGHLATPTGLAATAVSDTSVKLTWKDISTRESSYQAQFRIQGSTTWPTENIVTFAANAKEGVVPNLVPGKTYEVRLRAYSSATQLSGFTAPVTVRPKDGIAGDLTPPIFFGESFDYLVDVSRASALSNLTVGTPPAGLTYNATTRKITGTPTEEGVKTIALKATFTDGSVIDRTLTLRIIRKPTDPVVAAAFTPVTVAVGATTNVTTAGKFSDPDVSKAVRVVTTKGNFEIILYPNATPGTVTNFLQYVDGGKYSNMFFHRSTKLDTLKVVQGGGFTYSSADGFKAIAKIGTAKVTNEPGIANVRGTVALAKVSGDPDSGTNQFFVNVDNVNAPTLEDKNNGGFTVFGRVPEAKMEILDDINELPTKTYSLGTLGSFSDVPMDAATAPAILEPDKLVKVTSITSIKALSYEVTSATPGVATATVSTTGADPQIVVTGVAAGTAVLTVTARDLDGKTVSQTINVTVP